MINQSRYSSFIGNPPLTLMPTTMAKELKKPSQ
jgi:hypothetical protein